MRLPVTASARRLLAVATLLTVLAGPPAAQAEPARAQAIKVAGVVLKWVRGDREANFRRAEPLIREAAANGAQVVCTTECFLDGYAIADKSIPLETYRALGEPIPAGPYYRRLAALARELKIHLVAGMLEADGEARYNTAVLIDPGGNLLGRYRKQKLGHELVRNTPGKTSSTHRTPHGNVGLMICADRTEPAIVRGFFANGADFLLCPSGGMFGPRTNDPIVQARSRENRAHIVFVHPAEFLVTGPDGSVLARTLLGDRLLVAGDEVGGAKDSKQVFYFDLPLPPVPRRLARAAARVRTTIGHRGSSIDRPENTLAGVRRAIEAGATAVEVDVRTSRDGVLVCLHDADLGRTTDGKGKVGEKTLAELKALDAGVRHAPGFKGERIPTVREVLQLCRGKIDVMLDLKETGEEYAGRVAAEVRTAGDPRRTILGVRSVEQARLFRKLLPDARQIGLIPTRDTLEGFAEAGVDMIRLWPRWLGDGGLVARVRRAGAGLLVGASNGTREEVLPLLGHEPEALSSDDPAMLRRTLAEIAGADENDP